MNDINLYEKIPAADFPIRLHEYSSQGTPNFRLHWHEHIEILCIKKGQMTVRCADKIVKAVEGDTIVVNGNELHEAISGTCKYYCIILQPQFMEENHLIFDRKFNDTLINEYIEKIFEEYANFNSEAAMSIKGYAYLIVSQLMKEHILKTLTVSTYKQYSEKLSKVNMAIKYISENYSEEVTTSLLADILHVSEGHFCHIFRDITKKTAKEYINEVRIKKAVSLIETTDMTMTEIAMQCGFNDANYFSRIFRKYMGYTPTSLRK